MSEGQPTSYKADYADQAKRLCLLGYTDKELAGFFKVCEATINNWKHEYPKFLESIKEGKEDADCEVVESLYKKAKDGDTTATIFGLKNRQAKKWRDKQEIKQEVELKSITIKTVSK